MNSYTYSVVTTVVAVVLIALLYPRIWSDWVSGLGSTRGFACWFLRPRENDLFRFRQPSIGRKFYPASSNWKPHHSAPSVLTPAHSSKSSRIGQGNSPPNNL